MVAEAVRQLCVILIIMIVIFLSLYFPLYIFTEKEWGEVELASFQSLIQLAAGVWIALAFTGISFDGFLSFERGSVERVTVIADAIIQQTLSSGQEVKLKINWENRRSLVKLCSIIIDDCAENNKSYDNYSRKVSIIMAAICVVALFVSSYNDVFVREVTLVIGSVLIVIPLFVIFLYGAYKAKLCADILRPAFDVARDVASADIAITRQIMRLLLYTSRRRFP